LPEFFDNDPKVLCPRIPARLMEVEGGACGFVEVAFVSWDISE